MVTNCRPGKIGARFRKEEDLSKNIQSLLGLVLAVLIGLVALYAYSRKNIQAEDFALGKENFHGVETWNGLAFTGSSIEDIAKVVNGHASALAGPNSQSRKYIVWLGNSQLHYINQIKDGDHLAPYWFRRLAACPECIVPLGLSLPNANFQEYFVLSQYASERLPIGALVLEVVFDDLREDSLRSDFSKILSVDLRGDVGRFPVGKEILALADTQSTKSADSNETQGLDGFVQKNVEETLTKGLGGVWPLWKERANLRTGFLTDLYLLRNWALDIKPTTVRKMIKPRYERNMLALEAILSDYRQKRVPVVMYVAPIRQDHPLPYDLAHYDRWKQELQVLAGSYSATFVSLEKLVPNGMWGTYYEDDVDFMHFQGGGHKLVAEALFPIVQRVMK